MTSARRLLRGTPGRLFVRAVLLLCLCAGLPALADDDEPETTWLTQAIASIDGLFPTPWLCSGAAPAAQSILQFHRNWHCTNPDNSGPNWGNRFFGFHKQFLQGFNQYRAANGFPYIQTWAPAPGALIPPRHRARPANAPCPTCVTLLDDFKLPAAGGTLDDFATVTAIGDAIVGWHNQNHRRIADAGGADCASSSGPTGDMRCASQSPRDPIFYRYHNIFDDVQNAWRTHQDTDIMIVFDRSGSMSLPSDGGGTRLQAAKDAANLFADLMENGSAHRLGLASFSSSASNPPEMALTAVAGAPAAMTAALAGISASGATSIGGGLQQAQTTLAGGLNDRKAILLLTDGMENTAPTIADVQAALGDTHVCAVGLGTAGSLDGPKLRDLSERQGGIYISTPNALELKKFFVDCFADIFDSFVGEDPIEMLPAGQAASNPTIHTALGDEKLTFVLSWDRPVPTGSLRLEITSPSGGVVDFSAPGLESEVGDTWHIVRFPLPLLGEGDGDWQARAVRSFKTFVNGFTSDAFEDFFQGAELVRAELRYLCPSTCQNVLYYEDEMDMGEDATFDEHASPYAEALFTEVPRGTVGTVTRVRDPQEFAGLLRKGGYDLLVYASRFAKDQQPYDGILTELLCAKDAPRAIVSDNRRVESALAILRCAGAEPTDETNWDTLTGQGVVQGSYRLLEPPHAVGPFSFGLKPLLDSSAAQATTPSGNAAVIAVAGEAEDLSFFITALTRAPARVLPFTWISNAYTGEALHPTFHIPEMYWPEKGYDEVRAVVEVTRPLRSLGELASEVGLSEPRRIEGDILDPLQSALLKLDPNGTGQIIPTETLTFELFDDGTNGDGSANDRYWEASLPEDIAKFDGQYRFRAIFELCQGGTCVQREAQHTVVVGSKLSSDTTKVSTEPLEPANGRNRTRILVTPADAGGLRLGPGRADAFQVSSLCDVQVESVRDADGRGTYEIVVNWARGKETPTLLISQFGRPQEGLEVSLR